jgi:hypothetical protein
MAGQMVVLALPPLRLRDFGNVEMRNSPKQDARERLAPQT